MQRHSSTGVVMSVGLLTIALSSGCAGDDEGPTPSASAAPAPSQLPASGEATTSTDPFAEADRELRAAVAAYDAAYRAAVSAPGNRKALGRLLDLYAPESQGAKDIEARMKGLADRGFAGRAGPKGYSVIERVAVPSVEDGAQATVTVCTFDDGVVYDTRNTGPDGKPVVVNDEATSGRSRVSYVRRDGEWLLRGGDVVDSWKGANRCPAKG